jgi:formylmethanofuran dehydrogenase subunit E
MVNCDECGDQFPENEVRGWRYEPEWMVCENCYEQLLNDDEEDEDEEW